MHARRRLQTFAAASAILLLMLSGGIFAYATRVLPQGQGAPPGLLDDSQSGSRSTSYISTVTPQTEHDNETSTTAAGPTHTSTTTSVSETDQESDTSTATGQTSHHTSTSTNSESGQHAETSEEGRSSTHTESQTQVSSQETSTAKHETSNHEETGTNDNHGVTFKIVPTGQRSEARGEATLNIHGLVIDVHVGLQDVNATSQYSLVLSVNGTTHELGTLITDDEGSGEIRGQFTVDKPGTYAIGVTLLRGGTRALTSDPTTRELVLSQSQSSSSSTEPSQTSEESVSRVTGNHRDEQTIKSAEDSKVIPAIVQISGSGVSASVTDSRFSVSIGRVSNSGYVVTIAANNVTGPKTLLFNLTDSSAINLNADSLRVMLDGSPVAEASSVVQVLSPSPGDPARYAVIVTSSGTQLLVSIPHFSVHTLTFNPVPITQIQRLVAVNAEILLLAALLVTILFAAAYRGRKRFYSIAL